MVMNASWMAWLRKRATPSVYSPRAGFVFILGMHRSGTSCLTGGLERCGLFLGEVNRRARNNPKGNFEIRDATRLHEQILKANGGSWRHPPLDVIFDRRRKRSLRAIAVQLARHKPCGLKDPRLLFLLDGWLDIVKSYALVGSYRHPSAVARSLATRNQMPQGEAYDLWLRYNAELVRQHKVQPFPIVKFDLSDAEAYCRTVASLAVTLGLEPSMPRLREFVSVDLDHNQCQEEPVPTVCQEAYAYLERHRYQSAVAVPPSIPLRRASHA
jgi:hypothetical protein